jgi:hypothetical protein
MWARANSCAIVAAVSGKALGSMTVGLGGHVILTMAGMPLGSTQFDAQAVAVVDLATGQGCSGMLGQGGLLSRLGPGDVLRPPIGADLWC